jgi:hypothetical protein
VVSQETLNVEVEGQELPKSLSKRAFASHIGVSEQRVSQLIDLGLPVEANGRIDRVRGKSWYDANIDPNRKRASGELVSHDSFRRRRIEAEADIAALKAKRLAGDLIDRDAFLNAVEGRARAERDAWIGWVNRAAPELARSTGADLPAVIAILDRLVREQLGTLASQSIEDLSQ